jgi:hypothetical protein
MRTLGHRPSTNALIAYVDLGRVRVRVRVRVRDMLSVSVRVMIRE